MDIEPMGLAVDHHQSHHQQRDQNGADTQTVLRAWLYQSAAAIA
jgi:hypothetical protein